MARSAVRKKPVAVQTQFSVPTAEHSRSGENTAIVVDPEGGEHEMPIRNATDMVQIHGWAFKQTAEQKKNAMAHAPRSRSARDKKLEKAQAEQQKLLAAREAEKAKAAKAAQKVEEDEAEEEIEEFDDDTFGETDMTDVEEANEVEASDDDEEAERQARIERHKNLDKELAALEREERQRGKR